ncbi:MAG: hypothetical protein SGCHY_002303 [Lobulomycetales sp.]
MAAKRQLDEGEAQPTQELKKQKVLKDVIEKKDKKDKKDKKGKKDKKEKKDIQVQEKESSTENNETQNQKGAMDVKVAAKPPKPVTGKLSKAKKRERKLQEQQKMDAIAKQKAEEFLSQWSTDKANWKFQKNKQTWILKNLFSEQRISKDTFKIALKYLKDVAGNGRSTTLSEAERIKKVWKEHQQKLENDGEEEKAGDKDEKDVGKDDAIDVGKDDETAIGEEPESVPVNTESSEEKPEEVVVESSEEKAGEKSKIPPVTETAYKRAKKVARALQL